jgi:predicted nucleotidyltransferase
MDGKRLDFDQDKLKATLAEEPVEVAYLFGSQARGDAGPLSDVDVAVLVANTVPAEARLSLRLRLMRQLARLFDVERADVDILNDAPLLLQHRVLRDGRVLFSRDERVRMDYEVRALARYLDFRYFEQAYNEALIDRIQGEGLGARSRRHPGAARRPG